MDLKQLFSSSQDPQQVSMTVKATLLMFVPIVIGVAKLFSFDQITDENIRQLVEVIAQIVQVGLSLISLAGIGWGIIRKFVSKPS